MEIKSVINSDELRNRILINFKNCAPPLIFDRTFKVIEKNEARKIVRANTVKNIPYYTELFDCNAFSMTLMANISKWQVEKYHKEKDENYRYPICMGSCLIFNEKQGYHAVNIILLEEGFFYIEPQNNYFIEIQNKDEVLFISMRF